MVDIKSINPNSRFVSGLSHFKDPSAVLPTLIIEGFCTAGRTHQSYKRGGKLEAKERFREEAISAVFWLWGVKAFNKVGDIIGEKLFKINNLTDTGKDALRDPGYLMDKRATVFKFGKIISSVLLATAMMGFVVPKINHAITAKEMQKNKKDEPKQPVEENKLNINDYMLIAKSGQKPSDTYFGSNKLAQALNVASYKLENDNKWRLISTDAGMVAGRISNSRHPVEAFEYAFRDIASIYFYNFATNHAIKMANNLSKTPDVHPKVQALSAEFIKKAIGSTELSPEEFIQKFSDKTSDLQNLKINFDKENTLKLDDFKSQLNALGFNQNSHPELFNKAEKMSQLQPMLRGEFILSKQQVEDIFSNAQTSNPDFIKKALNLATDGRASDPKKFVARETTEKIRTSIDELCEYIANSAKTKNSKITVEFVEKSCKKCLRTTALFQALAMGFSAFGLAILVPKTQGFLSKKIFGNKSFEEIAMGKKE